MPGPVQSAAQKNFKNPVCTLSEESCMRTQGTHPLTKATSAGLSCSSYKAWRALERDDRCVTTEDRHLRGQASWCCTGARRTIRGTKEGSSSRGASRDPSHPAAVLLENPLPYRRAGLRLCPLCRGSSLPGPPPGFMLLLQPPLAVTPTCAYRKLPTPADRKQRAKEGGKAGNQAGHSGVQSREGSFPK